MSKGWIAIDGVSLTVVAVEPDRLSVCLIPETLERTTLGFKQVGDPVNLEFDGTAKVRPAVQQRSARRKRVTGTWTRAHIPAHAC